MRQNVRLKRLEKDPGLFVEIQNRKETKLKAGTRNEEVWRHTVSDMSAGELMKKIPHISHNGCPQANNRPGISLLILLQLGNFVW
jgi:hypothetical protein